MSNLDSSAPCSPSRRSFLKTSAAAAAATGAAGMFGAPLILNAADKSASKPAIVGEGEFQYACHHLWGELPDHIQWGDTHGVCVDEEGLIYIKHRNHGKTPMDAIAVFDEKGKFVRSFGKQWHNAGHGIDVRKENGEEFLYLSCIRSHVFAKTNLKGEVVWEKSYPKQSNLYDGPGRFNPTNISFGPDGTFYVGDGYGSHYVHQYDKDANWIRSWGGAGNGPGQLRTPHGQWLDARDGNARVLICDRANARLQYFSLDGKHLGYVLDEDGKSPVSFPADIDIQGDVMLVPDLHARVTLFDKNNRVITHLGYDPAWTKQVLGNRFRMRSQRDQWPAGKFIHPHDACFDRHGNIYVAEWVVGGRVTKLVKV